MLDTPQLVDQPCSDTPHLFPPGVSHHLAQPVRADNLYAAADEAQNGASRGVRPRITEGGIVVRPFAVNYRHLVGQLFAQPQPAVFHHDNLDLLIVRLGKQTTHRRVDVVVTHPDRHNQADERGSPDPP